MMSWMFETVVTCMPDFQLPMHRHENARIILITAGEISETDILGRRRYCAGDFIFRPPYYLHGNGPGDGDAEYMRLPVSNAALRSYTAQYGWRSGRGRIDLREWRRHRMSGDDLLSQVTACKAADLAEHQSDVDLHSLAGELREQPATGSILMRRAETMGMAPYQLTRRFARAFGLTPRAFGREARLYRALQRLANETPSLAQIAAECGYADQSHFTRDVSGATNKTPSQIVREFCFS